MGDKLTVYFTSTEDEALATKVAEFWKDHDFLTGKPQDLQLTNVEGVYDLRLIASDVKHIKEVSIPERKALLDLQRVLRDSVFPGKSFELIVCDNKFLPIYNINE